MQRETVAREKPQARGGYVHVCSDCMKLCVHAFNRGRYGGGGGGGGVGVLLWVLPQQSQHTDFKVFSYVQYMHIGENFNGYKA